MKKILATVIVCAALVGANAIYVNAGVAPVVSEINVHAAGNDDGQCHYCGPNKCPYFRAKSGADPTTCKCGHSKRSHVDTY